MQLEFVSGNLRENELKNLTREELVDLYNSMLTHGIKYGLDESRYSFMTNFTSQDIALKHCISLFSSVVAAKESSESIDSEDSLKPVSEPVKRAPRMSKSTPPMDAIITVLVDKNPKKRTAAERFNHYKTGMTVKDYCQLVGNDVKAVADVIWDTDHGWISWGIE